MSPPVTNRVAHDLYHSQVEGQNPDDDAFDLTFGPRTHQ